MKYKGKKHYKDPQKIATWALEISISMVEMAYR